MQRSTSASAKRRWSASRISSFCSRGASVAWGASATGSFSTVTARKRGATLKSPWLRRWRA
eukprot:4750634-Alexandrium_andersonii.AAC.1